jgi:predicted nucleic acid-binding Zn ribbon protein
MLTRHQALRGDHFGYAPDDVTCAHVGTLAYVADIMKRITDSAFTQPRSCDAARMRRCASAS